MNSMKHTSISYKLICALLCAVMLLPLIFDIDGIWWSITVAEAMAVITGTVCLLAKRKKYRYL